MSAAVVLWNDAPLHHRVSCVAAGTAEFTRNPFSSSSSTSTTTLSSASLSSHNADNAAASSTAGSHPSSSSARAEKKPDFLPARKPSGAKGGSVNADTLYHASTSTSSINNPLSMPGRSRSDAAVGLGISVASEGLVRNNSVSDELGGAAVTRNAHEYAHTQTHMHNNKNSTSSELGGSTNELGAVSSAAATIPQSAKSAALVEDMLMSGSLGGINNHSGNYRMDPIGLAADVAQLPSLVVSGSSNSKSKSGSKISSSKSLSGKSQPFGHQRSLSLSGGISASGSSNITSAGSAQNSGHEGDGNLSGDGADAAARTADSSDHGRHGRHFHLHLRPHLPKKLSIKSQRAKEDRRAKKAARSERREERQRQKEEKDRLSHLEPEDVDPNDDSAEMFSPTPSGQSSSNSSRMSSSSSGTSDSSSATSNSDGTDASSASESDSFDAGASREGDSDRGVSEDDGLVVVGEGRSSDPTSTTRELHAPQNTARPHQRPHHRHHHHRRHHDHDPYGQDYDDGNHEHAVFTVVTGGDHGELVLWRVRCGHGTDFEEHFASPQSSTASVEVSYPDATSPTVVPINDTNDGNSSAQQHYERLQGSMSIQLPPYGDVGSPRGHKHRSRNKKPAPLVRPRAMLVGGHASGSRVTGVAFVTFRAEESVVSVSFDGTLCIWSAEDGRCLAMREHVLAAVRPRTFVVLPSGHHVAAAGDAMDIELVDLSTMNIVHRLCAHSTWVSALVSADLFPQTVYSPMLVSASVDGVIHFWELDMLATPVPQAGELSVIPMTSTPIQTLTTKLRADSPVRTIALSPGHHAVLVVSEAQWQVLTSKQISTNTVRPHADRCLASVDAERIGWAGGRFVDEQHVLIWRDDGVAVVYRIPDVSVSPSLTLVASPPPVASLQPVDDLEKERAFRRKLLDPTTTPRTSSKYSSAKTFKMPTENNSERDVTGSADLHFTEPDIVMEFFQCERHDTRYHGLSLLPGHYGALYHQYFLVVREDGALSLWLLPKSLVSSTVDVDRSFRAASSAALYSSVDTSLQKEWSRLRTSLLKDQQDLSQRTHIPLHTTDTHTESVNNETTATLLIEELMLHVTGTRSGDIVLTPLLPLKSHDQADGESKEQFDQVVKHGVHVGAVTALLAFVDSTSSRFSSFFTSPAIDAATDTTGARPVDGAHRSGYTCTLVTAGADFVIRVWTLCINPESSNSHDFFVLTLLWKFAVHSGRVTKLFKAPDEVSDPRYAPGGVLPWEGRFDHAFFSISDDRTIGFFCTHSTHVRHLYGPHTDTIADIAWQLDQDFLVVRCENNTVAVWEMSTGELEGVVSGPIADEIWLAGQPMAPETAGDYRKMLSRGIAGFAPPVLLPPPQIMLINFRHLVESLSVPQIAEGEKDKAIKREWRGKLKDIGFQPTHGETAAISFLLPWGLDDEMDSLCEIDLGLQPPPALSSFAILGVGGALSLLVPDLHRFRLFGRSAYVNALVLLAARALLIFLGRLCEVEGGLAQRQRAYDRLRLFMDSALAAEPTYVAPSLALLAKFWGDRTPEVAQAARELFLDTAHRLGDESLRRVVGTWSIVLLDGHLQEQALASSGKTRKHVGTTRPASAYDEHTRRLAAVILGILGSHLRQKFITAAATQTDPELLTQLVARELAIMLDDSIDKGAPVVAAELLGDGFKLWRTQLLASEKQTIISQLFMLTMSRSPPSAAQISHAALMAIGALEPREFVVAMGKKILDVHMAVSHTSSGPSSAEYIGVVGMAGNKDDSPANSLESGQHKAALMAIGALIAHEPRALYSLLPRVCETVVQSLNPHTPLLREACLETSSKVLHAIVHVYPMVDFHRKTQRLALGTRDGVIVMYDLSTATRWCVLEGHRRAVTAVTFSESGKNLASYSLDDGAVRVWVVTSGFLGGMFGSSPHCQRVFDVDRIDNATRQQISVLSQVRITWPEPQAATLERDWTSSLTFRF